MEKRAVSTFVFPGVLGECLRALRRREGLSIVELAHLMDRKPGFGKHLSQLEQGRVRYPSLALIADYLRACLRATHRQACRASFADVLPLLDRYTSRPAVRESRAREAALSRLAGDRSWEAVRLDVYDRKTETARRCQIGLWRLGAEGP